MRQLPLRWWGKEPHRNCAAMLHGPRLRPKMLLSHPAVKSEAQQPTGQLRARPIQKAPSILAEMPGAQRSHPTGLYDPFSTEIIKPVFRADRMPSSTGTCHLTRQPGINSHSCPLTSTCAVRHVCSLSHTHTYNYFFKSPCFCQQSVASLHHTVLCPIHNHDLGLHFCVLPFTSLKKHELLPFLKA